MPKPTVTPFFDPATFTYTYVVADPATGKAAIIDPVYDYDPASGRISTESVAELLEHVRNHELSVEWILETHAHADHLTGAALLKQELADARVGIGANITAVQDVFAGVFNLKQELTCDGSQFDHLFADGERVPLGELSIEVMHTPGHTPACVTYVIGDAAFVGDTLFMPDYGTARTDFPGGDARTLYRSIQRILALPDSTRLFMCHDYLTGDRTEYRCETSVADERANNVHVRDGISEDDFVAMREARDATLAAPKLLLPSIQFNIRGGRLPEPEDNDTRYFKIPLKVA